MNKINECAWWEEFDTAVMVMRFLVSLKIILILLVGLSAVLDVWSLVEKYWDFWNHPMNDVVLMTAIQDMKALGISLAKSGIILICIVFVFKALFLASVPNFLLAAWSKDATMKLTTISALLNQFKWNGCVKFKNILIINRLGNIENSGLIKMKNNEGIKLLMKKVETIQ